MSLPFLPESQQVSDPQEPRKVPEMQALLGSGSDLQALRAWEQGEKAPGSSD